MKNYAYEARIISEDGRVICRVFASSQEGLEEEMGKKKWTEAVKKNEEENIDIDKGSEEMDKDRVYW